ncbi:HpcH/HpaI aldolase/citrate lyase family protein [Microbacterium sp. YY-01]|uniref:HpcH/HpaI aldolase/citrate lyase family protein n=1 Tax=Microbacterium sp. YY-01 TaxID=3421634 RepID=UPI003D17AA7D
MFAAGPALLFCPADRPERYRKAAERADGVILDLEDAVSADSKPQAREFLTDASNTSELDPARVVVRINPVDSAEHEHDLRALTRTPFRTIMVAKAQHPESLAELPAGYNVIALCETARGVVEAERIAALDRVVALMWGAEDLVASLGGTSSRTADGSYRDIARSARSRVLTAAGAYGKAAIDAVHVDIADRDGLRAEAEDAIASGFSATACIHPSQVETIRAAYRPTNDQLDWATRVLAAAVGERGVFSFDGHMVDEPVLLHARSILHRAGTKHPDAGS